MASKVVLLWSSAVFMVAYSLIVIHPVAEGAVTAEITVFVLLRVSEYNLVCSHQIIFRGNASTLWGNVELLIYCDQHCLSFVLITDT